MALVAYDYDSGSENEEDEDSTTATVIIPNSKKNETVNENNEGKNHDDTNNSENIVSKEPTSDLPELLSHLPKTKSLASSTEILEDKLEDFIPKYQPTQIKEKRQKVKITIPALADFQDDEDEEPEQKIRKTSSKGSSLLSILPPVKGSPLSTKSFVPYVLKTKQPSMDKPKSTTDSLVPNAVRKNAEQAKLAAIKKISKPVKETVGSDIESDDDIAIPETFDDEMWQKVCGRRTKPKEIVQTTDISQNQTIDIAPEPVKPYDGLDNAAFKELVGKSKRPVNIKLIDINEEEILSDKDLWLTKSLTDPDSAPKPVIENPVDPTRKKKHHITYLAEQAKANEQELQSQWSANKYTRNQTRAKYGF